MDPRDEFWDIVKAYRSWSITKIDKTKSLLVLKSKEKADILFHYNPLYIDSYTVSELKKQISRINSWWDVDLALDESIGKNDQQD